MDPKRDSKAARLVGWFDTRLGLSYPLLRPAPEYAMNPFYWLGGLAVVAFLIQGITGVMMMLYYVPNPTAAYTSTKYIFDSVYYGRFLETVHLYTAYAMIMLAFMHMMRDYLVSVHKKPREMMWVIGMFMGFVTLGFGFTGYLLPWTVVSKSATDVGIGMIDALPQTLSSFLSFLIVGNSGDATQLLRFYDLHVVVLPAVLLALLAAKMYMLEVHGISEPAGNNPAKSRLIQIFPDMTLYLLELAAIFGAGILLISAIFPLTLPPQYSPALAAQYTPQPDWYFLWIYQILKISIFEGPGLPVALSLITLIFIALILLPFIDRSKTRNIGDRPVFVTIGLIFIGELIALALWGLETPGEIIPVEQAVLVLGGTALIIAIVSTLIYRFQGASKVHEGQSKVATITGHSSMLWRGLLFTLLLSLGTLSIGHSLNAIVNIVLGGLNRSEAFYFVSSAVGLALAIIGSTYLLYRLDLARGTVKRRIPLFELGWENDGAT